MATLPGAVALFYTGHRVTTNNKVEKKYDESKMLCQHFVRYFQSWVEFGQVVRNWPEFELHKDPWRRRPTMRERLNILIC